MKRVILMSVITLLLNGCQQDYLNVRGIDYRTEGSDKTDMLVAGVRKGSGLFGIFSENNFEAKFTPKMENKTIVRKTLTQHTKETKKAALAAATKAHISTVGGLDTNVSTGNESNTSGEYHVFSLFETFDYVTELNSPKNRAHLESLMRYDDNSRIITSIATVFNHHDHNKVKKEGSLNLKVKNTNFNNPELTLTASTNGDTLLKLSDGAVFAYEYARICWHKVDGIIKVADITIDRPGMDNDCPNGTNKDASKL